MKTITIHQPEYLPYIGFFERLADADIFVVLDDVGYQKNAFMNRNKIKTNKGPKWITIPVKGRSSNLKINEVLIDNSKDWGVSQWGSIVFNYSKAPFFKDYSGFFEETFKKKWDSICELDIYLIANVINFLGFNLEIKKSSELGVGGRGTERLINICKELKADNYLSGPGNEEHQVEEDVFIKEGIKVKIRNFSNTEYPQMFMNQGFSPYMSIIDLLFNRGPQSKNIIVKN